MNSSIFDLTWTWIALPVACLVVTGVHWYYQRCFQYWTSKGVPGPRPSMFLGNMYPLMKVPWDQLYSTWTNRFGETFGIFEGWRPILVITNAEDVKDMTVKNFHKFINRRYLGGDPDGRKTLFFRNGDDWKRMRTVMSPTFSSGKMKQMYPLMQQCLDLFMSRVDVIVSKCDAIACKKLYGKLTSTIIARCAFATEIDPYTDEKNVLYQKLCKFFDLGFFRSLIIALGPQSLVDWLKLTFPDPDSLKYLNEICKIIVSKRKSNPANSTGFVDLLQSLVDAGKKSDAVRTVTSITDHEKHHSIEEKLDWNQNDLQTEGEFTEQEIASNLILFFAAGYETTSNVLNLSTFYLVKNPKIQDKLYTCIKEVHEANGHKFDYDSLTSLEYLDAFLCEVMRIQTPVLRVERLASEDHTFNSGVKVEKGTLVQIPIYPIHRSERYYEEPTLFKPERFLPENRNKIVSGSYLPFLIGPRNCIGMRFALIEAKMVLSHLLLRYKFVQTDATVEQLEGEPLNPIFIVKNELIVRFVKRN